jgi:hypothetical protein
MTEAKAVHITRLIAIPSVITLAVTVLRLVGELKHWPTPWFSTAAGGGGAVVGIWWLPLIFGPYFALKLTGAGEGAASMAKAVGFAFLSLLVFALAVIWFVRIISHPSYLTLVPLLLMLVAAFVPGIGWRSLGNTLVIYAFAARIPVVVVMYLAMHGNGGARWGTHYDAVPPAIVHISLTLKFLYAAIAPQMTMWIGWTAVLGSVFGTIVTAIARRGKQSASAAV